MKWSEIARMPTSVVQIPPDATGVHESCLRGYQILAKVKDYLKRRVPTDVILELIGEFEEAREE